MIASFLEIKMTPRKGRGVFTQKEIDASVVIEESPVVVLSKEERTFVEETILNDYIFEWGSSNKQACMALGYIAVYNHSYSSNCEYEMDYNEKIMRIKTVREVEAGEELTVNYNGEWNNKKPVWFEKEN